MKPDVAQFFKRVVAATALAAATLGFGGCQSVTGSTSSSQIRFIDASIDAGGMDMYMGTTAVAYNLGFGTITSYIPVTPATYTINVDSAGTRQVLASARATLANNKQYTVLVGNVVASLGATVLTDQSQPAPSGQVSLRFLDQSTATGAVDIYLVPSGTAVTAVTALQSGISFGTNTGYLNVPVGTYTLYIVSNGTALTATTTTLYTGAATTYPQGSARTIVLLDRQLVTTPALNVITANDYDSATATQ